MYLCPGSGDLSEGINDRHDFADRGVKGSPEKAPGSPSRAWRRRLERRDLAGLASWLGADAALLDKANLWQPPRKSARLKRNTKRT